MKEKFGDRLCKLRMQKGVSQARLAQDVHISPASVGMYESGQRMPSRETQEALADYFNVSLDYLTGRDSRSIYYLSPETAQIAQDIFDDPDLHALFDAAKDSKPENLRLAAEMLKRFKETNPDG